MPSVEGTKISKFIANLEIQTTESSKISANSTFKLNIQQSIFLTIELTGFVADKKDDSKVATDNSCQAFELIRK